MSQDNNFYAAPDAELGPDSPGEQPSEFGDNAPRDFGEVINRVFGLYGKFLSAMLLIALSWAVLSAVGGYAVDLGAEALLHGDEALGYLGIGYAMLFLGGPFFYVMALKRADNLVRGLETGNEISVALAKWFPVIGFGIGLGVLSGIGFMLCLIPGIVIVVYLIVGDLTIILEDTGVIDAFSRSYNLVKDNWWFAFGVTMTAGLLVGLPAMLIDGGVTVATDGDPIIGMAASAVVVFFVFPLGIAFQYVLFEAIVARNQIPSAYGDDAPTYDEPTYDDEAPGATGSVESSKPEW